MRMIKNTIQLLSHCFGNSRKIHQLKRFKGIHTQILITFIPILKKLVPFSKNLFSILKYVTYVVVPHA